MGEIHKVELNGESFYVKKNMLGWGVVEPIRDPETKQFIWRNFLNKKGFIVLGFILLLLGFSYLAFQEQITNYKKVMDDPCAYCEDCQSHTRDVLSNTSFTTKINMNLSI